MKRYAILLLFLATSARAQDIPLSKILVEGEGWKPASKDDPMAAALTKPTKPAVTAANAWRYEFDPEKKVLVATYLGPKLILLEPHTIKPDGLNRPAGLTLSPDKSTLFIGDAAGKHVWAFRTDSDGGLSCGDRYCALRMKPGEKASEVRGLATDSLGCIYACTPLGVQIFDPTGRLCGVLTKPVETPPTAIAFGGADGNMLYVAHGEQVFVRKVQVKGAK